MWLKVRDIPGLEIIPVYSELYPGFHDREIEWYENFFNTQIIKLPSSRYISYIKNHCYNPPHRIGFIDALDLFDFSRGQLYNEYMLKKFNAEYICVGIKKSDSLDRRFAKETKTKKFPILDFTDKDVIKIIQENNCKLPRDYLIWGCTLDGYTAKWTIPFKRELPEEFERAKKYLPLLEVDIMRYEKIKDQLPDYSRMDWRKERYAPYVMDIYGTGKAQNKK